MRKMLMAVLAGGLLAAGGAHAQGLGGLHQGGMGGHGYLGFLQGVTLTSAQQTQMHSIMKANWQQLRPQMQQLRALRQQIAGDLASTAAVNTAQLVALQQQAETLQAQLDQARLGTAVQVRALLTPEQLSQAATVHEQLAALRQQERNVLSQQPASAQ